MAQTRSSKIRVLRRRGKSRLVRVNDQLNTLTWEMFEKNAQLNDVNTRALSPFSTTRLA